MQRARFCAKADAEKLAKVAGAASQRLQQHRAPRADARALRERGHGSRVGWARERVEARDEGEGHHDMLGRPAIDAEQRVQDPRLLRHRTVGVTQVRGRRRQLREQVVVGLARSELGGAREAPAGLVHGAARCRELAPRPPGRALPRPCAACLRAEEGRRTARLARLAARAAARAAVRAAVRAGAACATARLAAALSAADAGGTCRGNSCCHSREQQDRCRGRCGRAARRRVSHRRRWLGTGGCRRGCSRRDRRTATIRWPEGRLEYGRSPNR